MLTNNIAGYILLSMPTDQVQPLSILNYQKKRVVNMTGSKVDDLFVDSEVPLPMISEDYLVSNDINKALSVDISVDSHLSLLEGLLKYLKLAASFDLNKNTTVKVHLMDARRNIVNEFKLDAYINSAKLNKAAKAFVEMLENDELYVVTDILKCKKYSIELTDQNKINAGLDAAANDIADAGANLTANKVGSDHLVNESEDFLTIGLKAYRIYYIRNRKTGEISYRIRKSEKIDIILGDEDFQGELLEADKINVKP